MSARAGIQFCAVALGVACAYDPGRSGAPSALSLLSVAQQAVLGAARVSLEAEAWRSFQPITGEAGDPLIVVARLHGTAPLDPQLRIDTLYVVRGNEIWTGRSREEQPRASGGLDLEVVARNGPPWASGDSIDVIAEVTGVDGQKVRLRSARIAVLRVD